MSASDSPPAHEVRILNAISDGKNKARCTRGGARKLRRVLVIVLLLVLVAAGVILAVQRMNDRDDAGTLALATPAPTSAPATEVENKRSKTFANHANHGDGTHADGAPRESAQTHASVSKSREASQVDVVELRNGESTASLLQRCQALDFVEREFCRWRICSGGWGSDPACKLPLADNWNPLHH